MMVFKILLIPLKLILKIAGFLFAILLKIMGFVMVGLSYVCGWVTNLIGGFIFLAAVFFIVCGFNNVGGLKEIENWWLSGVITGVVGFVIATMSLWVIIFGEKLSYWGECLWTGAGDIGILPD